MEIDNLRLTTAQIAAYIGRTEMTALRRIHLPPGHKRRIAAIDNGDGTYMISRQELEKHIQSEQLQLYQERTAALQRQLNSVVERQERLEGVVQSLIEEWEREGNKVPEIEAEREIKPSMPAELPDGSMTITEFAGLHDFNRRTLLAELLNESNKLDHEAFPVHRRREMNRYLTPEQQHAVIEFWRIHNKKFKECEQCREGKH